MSSFPLQEGHLNCQLMVDNSTKVAELILKSQIRVSNIDREVVMERDEDFLKKVQMKVKYWNLG
jgi:hypothetical protein